MNIVFLPFPELKTERLLLRRLTFDDRHELMWLRSDDRVNKYLDRGESMNIHEATEFIKKIDKNLEENKSGYWVISLAENQALIGTICLWNLELDKDLVELGYELSPMYQGKGIMHEAVERIITYAFETMQAKVITALTHPHNEPSRKVLERSGFEPDSTYHYINAAEANGDVVYFLLANSRSNKKT